MNEMNLIVTQQTRYIFLIFVEVDTIKGVQIQISAKIIFNADLKTKI